MVTQSEVSIFTGETITRKLPGTPAYFDFMAFCQKHGISVSNNFLTNSRCSLIHFGLPPGDICCQVLSVKTPDIRILQDTSSLNRPTIGLIMSAIHAEVTCIDVFLPDVSHLFPIEGIEDTVVRWRTIDGRRELVAEPVSESSSWPVRTHVWHTLA